MKTETQPLNTKPEPPPSAARTPRPLDSAMLLGNRDEVEIAHQGEIYRLRRTRQGKLILTK
ncbi:MAG: hemin uptake protein HemP [Sulfuritalea sp.]|nr:hemin uptake protein HemP [Sulfuritalea sp.]